jgi:hypothetical protein
MTATRQMGDQMEPLLLIVSTHGFSNVMPVALEHVLSRHLPTRQNRRGEFWTRQPPKAFLTSLLAGKVRKGESPWAQNVGGGAA